MARKTNKTAHVLNLITNASAAEENELPLENSLSDDAISNNSQAENSSPTDTLNQSVSKTEIASTSENISDKSENIKSPSSHTSSPVVEILYNEHDPLSDIIKNVLEETTDEIPLETANISEYKIEFDDFGNEIELPNETTNEPTIDSEPALDNDIDIAEAIAELEPISEPEPVAESSTLLERLESSGNSHFHDRQDLSSMVDLDFKCVNVYEKIVQNKLLEYMKKFDMCMCDRCIIDTFALAVTELPPKIVVVDKDEVFPLINFFEVQNTAMISTALIKACMLVKEKPHHSK